MLRDVDPAAALALDDAVVAVSSQFERPLRHLIDIDPQVAVWSNAPGHRRFDFTFQKEAELAKVQVLFLEYQGFETWSGKRAITVTLANGEKVYYGADSFDEQPQVVAMGRSS